MTKASKPVRIHPDDLRELWEGVPVMELKLRLESPWWIRLFCYEGPYVGIFTVRGQEYIQDASAPRMKVSALAAKSETP
jgi:hypothetical protein